MRTRGMMSKNSLPVSIKDQDHTFPELLSMVPDLLASHILVLWPSRSAGFRVLRLVSKEVGSFALRAVTSCGMTLGKWQEPDPVEVASLLGGAQLISLGLSIVTFPGAHYPSPQQQLSTCTSHMSLILARMGPALRSVKSMGLVMLTSLPFLSYSQWQDRNGDRNNAISDPLCQDDVSHIPAAVCAMLAAAVPQLKSLTLRGLCVNVALPVFGASCPQLRTLKVEAVLVPLSSLEALHIWFPNLAHFSIFTGLPLMHDKLSTQQCQKITTDVVHYAGEALTLLHGCSRLETLHLGLKPDESIKPRTLVMLPCAHTEWDSLPASLHEFSCDVVIIYIMAASSFVGRMQSLTLAHFPGDSLPELLLQAPLLKICVISSEDPIQLMWDEDITPLALASVKAHLLSGFRLRCLSVAMYGTVKEVQDLTTWLSPLLDTVCIDVSLEGRVVDMEIFNHLVQACPALEELELQDESPSLSPLQVDEGILWPLGRLMFLEKLYLHMQIDFTTAGLICLCQRLPKLYRLRARHSEYLCSDTVAKALQGRVEVKIWH